MSTEVEIAGHVAKILSDTELVLNIGAADGVERGNRFQVIDRNALDISDPETMADLGSIKRVLATVQVHEVYDRMSVAVTTSLRRLPLDELSVAMSGVLGGGPPRRSRVLGGDSWPEGVRRGDPVVKAPPPKNVD